MRRGILIRQNSRPTDQGPHGPLLRLPVGSLIEIESGRLYRNQVRMIVTGPQVQTGSPIRVLEFDNRVFGRSQAALVDMAVLAICHSVRSIAALGNSE